MFGVQKAKGKQMKSTDSGEHELVDCTKELLPPKPWMPRTHLPSPPQVTINVVLHGGLPHMGQPFPLNVPAQACCTA